MVLLWFLAALVDPSLARLHDEDARVAAIAWRLQTANAALCPVKAAVTGLSLHALSQYRRDQRAAAAAMFALGDRVGVAAIAPGSAADRAGLRAGDAIVAIDTIPAPRVTPGADYAPVAAVETALDNAQHNTSVRLDITRADAQLRILLIPDQGCASRVQIVGGTAINAQADGSYVQINSAMVDLLPSDDALAAVIAHELAHNILRHRELRTPSRQAEYEADRLSVWLLARSGYDVGAIIPLWSRLGKRAGAGIFSDGSHPSTRRRIAALSVAVAELKAQRANGQPLVPPSQPVFPR